MKLIRKLKTLISIFLLLAGIALLPQGSMATEGVSLQFEPVIITVSDSSEVTQRTVLLADIATFEGDNLEYIKALENVIVSRSPKLGKESLISRELVINRINRMSRSDQRAILNMSPNVTAFVPAREIEASEIRQQVDSFLKNAYSREGTELKVFSIGINESLFVPEEEEIHFRFEVLRGSTGRKLRLKMALSGDKGYQATRRVPVDIELLKEMVVANRTIPAREVIKREDLKRAFIPVTNLHAKTIKDFHDVVGKASKTNIQENSPLNEKSLKEISLKQVVVAVRDIASKKIIEYEDVRVTEVNAFDIHRKTYERIEDVVGKVSKTNIRKNSPLAEDSLKEVSIKEIVVAARNIASKEIIEPEDVRLVEVNVSDIRRKTFDSIEDVVGKAAATSIKTNSPLFDGALKEIPVISRGASVIILAEGGGFQITVPGVAKQNGFQDQMIRVENINSKKNILAKVLDSKTVRVQF